MNLRPTDDNSIGRSRIAAVALLTVVAGAAWFYTVNQTQLMATMGAAPPRGMVMSMNGVRPAWLLVEAALTFLMWTAMMAAMMLPGAAPMIAAFAAINRRRKARAAPSVSTAVFLTGYLAAWAGFALLAVVGQYAFQAAGLLTTAIQSASNVFSAALFFAAGLYQFSPLKERCLSWCRSTDAFILTEWRDGMLGAAIMGLRHGLFCMGCCAALMLLLFAVAVMDLRWVAVLALLVSAEKLLPCPRLWRHAIGVVAFTAAVGFALAALRV